MNKENCALKLVDEIILYYDARSKKHKKNENKSLQFLKLKITVLFLVQRGEKIQNVELAMSARLANCTSASKSLDRL